MRRITSFPTSAVLAVLLWPGLSQGAETAQDTLASPWYQGFHSKARLIGSGPQDPSGPPSYMVGIEIVLDEGWKTYWRTPGEGGLPPTFDWSGSANVGSAELRWPAPHRFQDATGESIGYQRHVVFPVVVTPEHGQRPSRVRLALHYAVCKDICVPSDTELSLTLAPGISSAVHGERIAGFLAQVPQPVAEDRTCLPRLRDAVQRSEGGRTALTAVVAFPPGASARDLFVEAPDHYYLPLPRIDGPASGDELRYRVDLSLGGDAASLTGKELTFTAVSDIGSCESRRRVE